MVVASFRKTGGITEWRNMQPELLHMWRANPQAVGDYEVHFQSTRDISAAELGAFSSRFESEGRISTSLHADRYSSVGLANMSRGNISPLEKGQYLVVRVDGRPVSDPDLAAFQSLVSFLNPRACDPIRELKEKGAQPLMVGVWESGGVSAAGTICEPAMFAHLERVMAQQEAGARLYVLNDRTLTAFMRETDMSDKSVICRLSFADELGCMSSSWHYMLSCAGWSVTQAMQSVSGIMERIGVRIEDT